MAAVVLPNYVERLPAGYNPFPGGIVDDSASLEAGRKLSEAKNLNVITKAPETLNNNAVPIIIGAAMILVIVLMKGKKR